jgi:metal-dependent amidase/aminoacylase/carboxypeptidase family protein
MVNFNAEYDALPDIGHACSHNLITSTSLTGFMGTAFVVQKFGVEGRVQLLGTPAEGSGGKIELINAGAYKDASVSLMGHPFTQRGNGGPEYTGAGGMRSIASLGMTATVRGKTPMQEHNLGKALML